MRYAVRSLSCPLLFLFATTLCAQETKAPWWKFGMGQDAPVAAAPPITQAPTMSPAPETITPIEEDSWFAWPAAPKWHWPTFASDSDAAITDLPATTGAVTPTEPATPRRRIPLPRYGNREQGSRPRNTWAQQPASVSSEAADGSTWESMKSSTRNAWHKTVDFVTPGEELETTVVDTQPRSSWWKSMWGSESQEGPQTVTEWMAQDRIDP